ncbi:hypothetical protein GB2207_02537 [gamma proteobacterium HTCC2207]|uniref:Uncharacterized protein n=1 Tax=gamma proteobacterium HTCC2207 TaxID=314287 RepID=Q1YT42_9GAMM|nr:hypothetical protein GB2207_02537 [gamma proteobacterium HTCC2207]
MLAYASALLLYQNILMDGYDTKVF